MEELKDGGSSTSICSYSLYAPAISSDREAVADLIPPILAFVHSLSAHHIYHSPTHPFTLALSLASPWHLTGTTDCTDSVDDEWLIVHLLRQISAKWPHLAVQVDDEDGQFLLIEAAEELPKWLTPDNADNRVWIHQGAMHLIPLTLDNTTPLSLASALQHLTKSSALTVSPPELQSLSFARATPPSASLYHNVTLPLPSQISSALYSQPQLVAEAISAFYNRDPDTTKHLTTMAHFGSDLAHVQPARIRMTRAQWATLKLQKFFPPKPFLQSGGNWEEGGSEGKKGCAMKLICGFEILYSQTLSLPRILAPHPLTQTAAYTAFASLASSSSPLPSPTPESLLSFYETASVPPINQRRSFAQRLDDAVSSSTAPSTSDLALPDDSEDWLSVDVDGLDALLEERGGQGELDEFSDSEDDDDQERDEMEEDDPKREEGKRAKQAARRMKDMVGKIEEFVDGKGDIEGVVFKDEESDNDDGDSDDDEVETKETAEELATRKKAFLESLVPALPSTEWGASTLPPRPTSPPPPPLTTTTSSSQPARPPKLSTETYDGATDSDTDSGDEDDMERDEDEPALEELEGEGADGVDMDEEMEAFLTFATETLGLTKEQYEGILEERAGRGAFVPRKGNGFSGEPTKPKSASSKPSLSHSKKATIETIDSSDDDPDDDPLPIPPSTKTMPSTATPQPLRNPNLKDFDALMAQMDAELANVKQARSATATPDAPAWKPTTTIPPSSSAASKAGPAEFSSKPKPSQAMDVDSASDEEDDDDEVSDIRGMEAELASILQSTGAPGGLGHTGGEEGGMDYDLVKNFLESFKSQGGFAGPAGSLAGRLGFKLPRSTGTEEEEV